MRQSADELLVYIPDPVLNLRRLVKPEFFLDSETLESRYGLLSSGFGAVDARWGSRFAQQLGQRVAARIGRRHGPELGLSPQLVANAWQFAIWAELCVLSPARHLARKLARLAGENVVMIPIARAHLQYLRYWDVCECESFYLAAALWRRGVRVCLVLDASTADLSERGQKLTLHFDAYPAWRQPPAPDKDSVARGGGRALVMSGMRGVEAIRRFLAESVIIQSAFVMRADAPAAELELDEGVERLGRSRIVLERNLHRVNRNAIALYRASPPRQFLLDELKSAIGDHTRAMFASAKQAAAQRDLVEAHVCDHRFFESALVAEAVRQRGGSVTLWPHSSNPVHTESYRRGEIAQVYAVTASGAALWRHSTAAAPVSVASELMLKPASAPRPTMAGEKLTIVVFASGHFLGRVPLLDIERHKTSYRDFFRGLDGLRDKVSIVFKSRPPSEDARWLNRLLDRPVAYIESQESTLALNHPNMVFVSMSFGSSALLEGLSRGIPGMIVRDFEVEDYTCFTAPTTPIGPVAFILDEIVRCLDLRRFGELASAQLDWYRGETRFGALDVAPACAVDPLR